MSYRSSKFLPRPSVLIISVILAGIIVNGLVPTPNVVGGGAAKMIAIIFLMVIFKVMIEYFLSRWQKRKDEKRDDKNVV